MSNNVNEFLSHLADDIKKEIGNYADWDIAEYPIVIQKDMISSGLIILKKQGEEISRISQKESFSKDIRLFFDPTKINKGTLTIYPSGEYESSFIWDEEAHINNLILRLEAFFDFIREEVCNKVAKKFSSKVLWEKITTTIPFKLDKVQPINIEIKRGESITNHSMLIQNICYEENLYLVQRIEEIYYLTNEGELKGQLSEKWNTIILNIQAGVYYDFYRDVSFEWREENA